MLAFVSDPSIVLFFTLCFSIAISLAHPLMGGVYSDYINRLGPDKNNLIALQSSMGSFGWILGPIIAGIMGDAFGYQQSFAVMGVIAIIVSIISFVFTPRKVQMPQTDLDELRS